MEVVATCDEFRIYDTTVGYVAGMDKDFTFTCIF